MKFLRMTICSFWICSLAAAETLFDGSQPENWISKTPVTVSDGTAKTVLSYASLRSAHFIPVVPGKKYTITGEFRLTGKTPPMVYFGVIPYTGDDREIPFAAIQPASPKIAVLSQAAAAGSRSVFLKNAADWKFVPNARLAFNAKPDKSDLPNLDLSPAIQVSEVIIHPDRSAEVALKTPLRKAYPAGTSVRMHLSGNSYIYAGYGKKAGTWMTFTRTYTSFYRGCRKIKPAVSAASSKCPVEFRNVKVVME